VFFAFDQFQIDLNSARLQAELEKIMSKYREHPGTRIQVNGYTDDIGDPLYNEILSKRRAEEIKNELVRRGIPENKISTTGFGSKFPIMPNDRPEGRMLNRRVEVDVISTR
ncbi:OmpA family protein, partial [candidate division KSB1 bacterium]|nr:OmpA family protein [candidate division KSB1 bacterium]